MQTEPGDSLLLGVQPRRQLAQQDRLAVRQVHRLDVECRIDLDGHIPLLMADVQDVEPRQRHFGQCPFAAELAANPHRHVPLLTVGQVDRQQRALPLFRHGIVVRSGGQDAIEPQPVGQQHPQLVDPAALHVEVDVALQVSLELGKFQHGLHGGRYPRGDRGGRQAKRERHCRERVRLARLDAQRTFLDARDAPCVCIAAGQVGSRHAGTISVRSSSSGLRRIVSCPVCKAASLTLTCGTSNWAIPFCPTGPLRHSRSVNRS